MQPIPAERLFIANQQPISEGGHYILYWMRAARRTGWNFALQHALHQAVVLAKPLLILETLACDEPLASLRHHHFALDGMAVNARRLRDKPALYYPFVERGPQEIAGLMEELARTSCLIITDDHPLLWMRKELNDMAERLPVRLDAVDGNGLLPLQAADRDFTRAYSFRRFLQQLLPGHLFLLPEADPWRDIELPPPRAIPKKILQRWPQADPGLLDPGRRIPADLPLALKPDRVQKTGGSEAAEQLWQDFLEEKLARYAADRNQPEQDVTSGLSPYLRWGHISSHQMVSELLQSRNWSPADLSPEQKGKRRGWWGLGENTEAFLDQLVTWRELGYIHCARNDDYDRFDALPDWAQKTLLAHADDPRPFLYDKEELESARTHDPLWNAAQRQLLTEGRLHNYLRMLWGKKILQWTRSPRQALDILIELNDRYAIDGRDPNSYSGITWCLGQFDRAWGPERPIFGKIRYMSSENTARKVSVKNYLKRYGSEDPKKTLK
ncbi:MAG: deoxyribodipyrimidine photolyase [Syntrophotaleaceae bacterium]